MKIFHSLKAGLLTAVVLVLSFSAEATHYRYGNISWERVSGGSGYRVQFKVSIAWRKSFNYQWNQSIVGSQVPMGTAFRTNNTSPVATYSPQLTVTSINASEDWFYGEATFIHDYGRAGVFNPFWTGCCRISTLQNNADRTFTATSRVELVGAYGTLGSNNASPVTSITPIINLSAGLTAATVQIPAIDPDGDAVSYRLANPNEAGNGSANPAGVSIDATTGLLSFNTNGKTPGALYNVIVVVSDGKGATTMIDFLVKIVQPSTPPAFVSPTPSSGTSYQLQPGQALNFTISATDSDPADVVTLQGVGLPPGSAMNPGLPTSGTNAVSSSFSWTPSISDLGSSVINFTATDNAGTQVSTSVSITVSLKPQFASTTPSTGSVWCLEPNGNGFSTTVSASDPDPNDVVSLSYSGTANGTFGSFMPTPAANPTSVTFSYNPVSTDWGVQTASFTATDSYNDTRTINWTFVVNTPPVFTSTPVTQVNVGQNYSYVITLTDADIAQGDQLAVETANYPSWMTLTPAGTNSWELSGTPTLADVGMHNVDIEIEDNLSHAAGVHCGHAHQGFTVEVIPCNLSMSGVVSDALCNGGSTGAIDLSVSGANGNVSYAWSNGATTEDISGLSAGSYSVTITDGYGCTETAGFTVGEPAAITHNFSSTPILCYGGLSTQSLTVYGGTPPYTVTNQGGGALAIGFGEGVTVGGATYAANYIYTITDANGCTSVFNASITQPSALSASASSPTYIGGNNVSCNGATDGSADLTVGGGTPPYTYAWSNGAATEDLSNIGAGSYSVTVTDANGCSISTGVTLTEPSMLLSSLSVTPAIGVNPGGQPNTIYIGYGPQSLTLDASASGGTAPYTYAWTNAGSLSSGSGSSVSASPSATTTYTVTVSDANGCTSSQTVTITVVDVRCGKNGNKVLVCKVPPGNANNAHNICVSANAVASHLATGSYLGPCTNKTGGWTGNSFTVFPNPNTGVFTLAFELTEATEVVYQIMDMSGRMVVEGSIDEIAGHYQTQLDMTTQPSGMYIIRFITGDEIQTERISIQR